MSECLCEGIGDRAVLDQVGLETVIDLPGVGANLRKSSMSVMSNVIVLTSVHRGLINDCVCAFTLLTFHFDRTIHSHQSYGSSMMTQA